jgi:hypothetical protein
MAKKKKRPPPPRDDAELIDRLSKKAPQVLEAQVDFDEIVIAVLSAPSKAEHRNQKAKKTNSRR